MTKLEDLIPDELTQALSMPVGAVGQPAVAGSAWEQEALRRLPATPETLGEAKAVLPSAEWQRSMMFGAPMQDTPEWLTGLETAANYGSLSMPLGIVKKIPAAAGALEDLIKQPPLKEPPIRQQKLLPGSVGTPEFANKGISPRVADAIANPEVARGLLAFSKAKEGYGRRWYNTKQLLDAWKAELGDVEGQRWFDSFMDIVGAMSPTLRVVPNIRAASNMYKRVFNKIVGGKPLGENLPVPYQKTPGKGNWTADKNVEAGYGTGTAMPLHQRNLQDIFNNGGMDPVKNPKPPRFIEGLKGNFKPQAIDRVMMRVLGMLSKDPRFLAKQVAVETKNAAGKKIKSYINPAKMYKNGELTLEEALKDPKYWEAAPDVTKEYPHLEKYFSDLAKSVGMEPAEFQASIWLGGGPDSGLGSSEVKSFAETFFDQVKRRALIMKTEPKVVLKKFIRGDIALTIGGGAVFYSQLPPSTQDGVATLAGEGGT